jgi:hypothetical protein
VLPWKRHAGFASDLGWRTPAERSHAALGEDRSRAARS